MKTKAIALQEDGYVFLPQLIPTAILNDIKKQLDQVLHHHCNYQDETTQRIADRAIYANTAIHHLPFLPSVQTALQILTNNKLLIHPKIVVRVIPPQDPLFRTNPHQDHFTVRGTPDTYTIWIPLHDCTPANGSLRVVKGSHQMGLRDTEAGYGVGGVVFKSPVEEDWTDFNFIAGDALVFHSFTIHSACYNASKQYRLSVDFRFQDQADLIHPASLLLRNTAFSSWDELYQLLPDYEHPFYWNNTRLNFSPGSENLKKLAAVATDPEKKQHLEKLLSVIASNHQ